MADKEYYSPTPRNDIPYICHTYISKCTYTYRYKIKSVFHRTVTTEILHFRTFFAKKSEKTPVFRHFDNNLFHWWIL